MSYCPYMSPNFGAIPAGFWRRAIAAVVDQVLVAFAGFVLGLMASPLLLAAPQRVETLLGDGRLELIVLGGYLLVGWIYFAGFESSEGQATIGKTITGTIVCDLQGGHISFWRASLRYLAKFLSILTLGIGFFIMVRHPRRQALHDRVAKTVVAIHLDSPIVGPA